MRRELYGFVSGLVVTLIVSLLSWVLGSHAFFSQVAGWIGCSALAGSLVFSGALLQGDSARRYSATETSQDRTFRTTVAGTLFLFSIPLLGALAVDLIFVRP